MLSVQEHIDNIQRAMDFPPLPRTAHVTAAETRIDVLARVTVKHSEVRVCVRCFLL